MRRSLFCAVLCLACLPVWAAKQSKILNFDTPVSLGRIIRLPGLDPLKWPKGGPVVADARGRVTVPAGPLLINGAEPIAEHGDVIGRLPADSIAFLNLDNLSINDDFIEKIGNLKGLQKLSMRETEVSDRGLATLKRLPNLTDLIITNTNVRGTTIGQLAGHTKLRRLVIADNKLDPSAYEGLGKLTGLQVLEISRCGADDNSLAQLANLNKLYRFSAANNPHITPVGLKNLSRLPSLLELQMQGCGLKPCDYLVLKGTNLKVISLEGNYRGSAQVRLLKKQWPTLEISFTRQDPKWPTELFAPLH